MPRRAGAGFEEVQYAADERHRTAGKPILRAAGMNLLPFFASMKTAATGPDGLFISP
jgi:hypothetical protein